MIKFRLHSLEKMRSFVEGNFIYSKLSKRPELISFLFGNENPIVNNLLDVKKLSVFVTYVTTEFYIFGKQTLGF